MPFEHVAARQYACRFRLRCFEAGGPGHRIAKRLT